MGDLVMKVRTKENMKLSDDEFVEQCMDMLLKRWPQIENYSYLRDDEFIFLFLRGEFTIVE